MADPSARNSDAELVERVRKLQPLIRSHALRTEQARRVTGEVVTALTDAGVLRMNVPRRYGGYQTSVRTQVDVLSEVSAACGSSGFMALIQAGCAFIAALFPDEAQDEIFTGPDVRVSGTLIPKAKARPVDGGYVVEGTSPFATGCQDSDWHLLTTVADSGGVRPPDLLWTAIPMTDLDVLDDWHVSGLAGSGSNSVVAHDVHVASPPCPATGAVAGRVPPLAAQQRRSLLRHARPPAVLCLDSGSTPSARPGRHWRSSASASINGASPTRSTSSSTPPR